MKPGDVFVTNDPWLGTGHLFDYVMMTPVFLGKTLVAFFASTCHVIDVGGVGMSAKANSSFEEGTLIPHMTIRKARQAQRRIAVDHPRQFAQSGRSEGRYPVADQRQ